MCEQKPMLKDKLGCSGPPRDSYGSETEWQYPPEAENRLPEFSINVCPVKYLSDAWDVVDLFSAGYAAEWRISISEREMLPVPYVDAWMLARRHVNMSEADRYKKRA